MGAELEMVARVASARFASVLNVLVDPPGEILLTASKRVSACTGEWCSADRIEKEAMYVVVRGLGGEGSVTRYTVGTAADGELEAWGHGHDVVLTVTQVWPALKSRWSEVTRCAVPPPTLSVPRPRPFGGWTLTVGTSNGVALTWNASGQWLLKVEAPGDELDELRRQFAEWAHGRNHRVIGIVTDMAVRLGPDDDPICIAQSIVERGGWTDLRMLDMALEGDEVVVRFAGTRPESGGQYAYRDPPYFPPSRQ